MKSIKDGTVIIFFATVIISLLIFIFNDKYRSLQNLDKAFGELTQSINELKITIRLSDKDIEIVDQKTKINAKAINILQKLHKNNK